MLCWLLTDGSRDGKVGDGGPENGHECSLGDGDSGILWEGMVVSGSLWDPFGPQCLGRGQGEQQTPTWDPQNLSSPGRRASVTEELQGLIPVWDPRVKSGKVRKPHQLHITPRGPMVRLTGGSGGRGTCAWLFTSDSPEAAGYRWKCSRILFTSSVYHSESPLTS